MSNEELLQQYEDGDASAVEQLYEPNVGLIKQIAEKCLLDFWISVEGHNGTLENYFICR